MFTFKEPNYRLENSLRISFAQLADMGKEKLHQHRSDITRNGLPTRRKKGSPRVRAKVKK